MALSGRAGLVVEGRVAAAADPSSDALSSARAALKRAINIRRDAELQVEQLRALVERLEAIRR